MGHEVDRPVGEREPARVRRVIRSDDEDRSWGAALVQLRERRHHLKTTELGHVQIEQDQVRGLVATQARDHRRVAGGLNVLVSRRRKHPLEHLHLELVVVHDKDPHSLQRDWVHAPVVARCLRG